jgi:hypothetical protein
MGNYLDMDLLELDLVPEAVPAEEGRGVGDLPLLDETVAVVVRRRPDTLLHVRRSDQSKNTILSEINKILRITSVKGQSREIYISSGLLNQILMFLDFLKEKNCQSHRTIYLNNFDRIEKKAKIGGFGCQSTFLKSHQTCMICCQADKLAKETVSRYFYFF